MYYLLYVLAFSLSLFTNSRALMSSNLETIIVFRSTVPIFVCILEFLFLGREMPCLQSLLSLVGIVLGALGYVLTDDQFFLEGWSGYSYVLLYVFMLSFDMAYGKKLTNEVNLTIWGSVFYTNSMSLVVLFLVGIFSEEFRHISDVNWQEGNTLLLLFMSCIVSTGISYAGWNCRSLLSATSYTVVGVLNKLLAVFLSYIFFADHAKPEGIFCLLICLISGYFYKQAPLLQKPTKRIQGPV